MSQIEENQATSKSESRGTVIASLAAVGSVIAASSCCLPLLPAAAAFSLRRRSSGHLGLCRTVATLPACSVSAADCLWLLQVLASEAMQLQAQLDQHSSLVVLGVCRVCIHLFPTGDRQPGSRSVGR